MRQKIEFRRYAGNYHGEIRERSRRRRLVLCCAGVYDTLRTYDESFTLAVSDRNPKRKGWILCRKNNKDQTIDFPGLRRSRWFPDFYYRMIPYNEFWIKVAETV